MNIRYVVSAIIVAVVVTIAPVRAQQPTTTEQVKTWSQKQWNRAKAEFAKDKAKWTSCQTAEQGEEAEGPSELVISIRLHEVLRIATQQRGSPNRRYGTSRSSGSTSLRVDVGRPDFLGDELTEIGGRAREHRPEAREPRLDLGIGEAGIDLGVELVDDRDGCGLRRADAEPDARLVARRGYLDNDARHS